MEQSLDFDIKNYSTEDLINFFKLDNNYTITELDENYKAITVNVLKSSRNLQYKYDLIDFINNGKTILLKNIVDENETIIKKRLPKTNIQKQDDDNVENIDIDETVGKY